MAHIVNEVRFKNGVYILVEVSFYIVNVCPDSCCGKWKSWDPINRYNHTSWMAIVTPTDRPKSVRNSCVIEIFGRFCVVTLLFLIFLWV